MLPQGQFLDVEVVLRVEPVVTGEPERAAEPRRALDADRPAHHLSGGERRRAALATVLAMDPDVLVFDEPSSDLDGAGRRELVSALSSLGLTQIVITHDLPLALELCPRAVIMRDGRIVADGETRSMLADASLLAENRLELPYGFQLGPRED